MQTEHTEKLPIGKLLRAVGISTLGTIVLLMLCAVFSPRLMLTEKKFAWAGEGGLLLSSVLCGALCARTLGSRKLIAALTGNGAMLAVLLILCGCLTVQIEMKRIAIMILILAFGSFAGAVCTRNGHKRSHRKRR